MVHLDKLRLSSRREESDVLDAAGGKDPDIIVKNASESKGGVIEKLVKVCQECGEEFCYGACVRFQYDCYQVCCPDQSYNHLHSYDYLENGEVSGD